MATSLSISLSHTALLYISKAHTESITDSNESSHKYQSINLADGRTMVDIGEVDGGNDLIFIRNTSDTTVGLGPSDSATATLFIASLGKDQVAVFPMKQGSNIWALPSADSVIEVICIEVT